MSSRIPSLDGLRAISIGLVLFAHAAGTRFTPGLPALRSTLGNLGVRIFFVISGFLITTLLLQERAATGRVSLKLFYLRRALRIFPCAYTYIAVAWLLAAAGWVALGSADFMHAVTYTVNYQPVRPWHLIHLWSLSVEEQFYMLWPALLVLLGPRRAMWAAAAALALAPLARLGTWHLLPWLRWSIGTSFQTNADALAAGCLLAGIRPWLTASPRYLGFLRSRAWLVLPAAGALVCAGAALSRMFSYTIGQTALNLLIAVIIDRCVRFHDDAFGRLLNLRPVVFIGVLSYSLYLWQEPFLNREGSLVVNWFPINLVLSFLAALASYYLVEKPFLRLRRSIETAISARAATRRMPSREVRELQLT